MVRWRLAPRLNYALPVAVAVALLSGPRQAPAEALVWTVHGPAGGNVYCIVPDPSRPQRLYAGTDRGVFRSDDSGVSWQAASAGMPVARVQTIAIDPTDTATLYAGTLTPNGVPSLGIFKSTDAGATWIAANNGLVDPLTGFAPLDVGALAIDPAHPGTLLAGARYSEIFQSTDAGATWQPMTLGGYNIQLQTSALVFDPADPSRVYAAGSSGLLLSTDGGENWSPYGDAGVSLYALAADPAAPSTLYAGNVSGFGILKSTDGGAHWIDANSGLPATSGSSGTTYPRTYALVADASKATLSAGTDAGLFESADGGATWSAVPAGFRSGTVTSLALSAGQPAATYAGTLGAGIYSQRGADWSWSSAGLDLSLISAIVADPAAPDTLFAAAFDGVHASTDGGASWARADSGLPVYPAAALARSAAGSLFVGTLGGGLLESSDGGASWNARTQGLDDAFVSAVAVDPGNASVLYAGSGHAGTSAQHVYKSVDGGNSWAQTSLAPGATAIDGLAVDPSNSQRVAAFSRGASSYFQSPDSGSTWSSVTVDAACGTVNALLFETSASTTYVGGTVGVCRSADGGKTWTVAAVAGSASVRALLLDPDSSILYAGGAGGVSESSDGGQAWQVVGSGLETSSVVSLALGPSRTLFAGVSGGSVAALAPLVRDRLSPQPVTPGIRPVRELPPR